MNKVEWMKRYLNKNARDAAFQVPQISAFPFYQPEKQVSNIA